MAPLGKARRRIHRRAGRRVLERARGVFGEPRPTDQRRANPYRPTLRLAATIRPHPMVGPESSVTAMSGRRPGETWRFARLGRLARASLSVLAMGMGGQSCVITANPEINPPKRTAPLLTSVNPAPYLIQELPSLGATGG